MQNVPIVEDSLFATNIVKIRTDIKINENFDLVSRFRIQLVASLVSFQESVEFEYQSW